VAGCQLSGKGRPVEEDAAPRLGLIVAHQRGLTATPKITSRLRRLTSQEPHNCQTNATVGRPGAVMADDLSPQKARILLMLLLQEGVTGQKNLQAAFDL